MPDGRLTRVQPPEDSGVGTAASEISGSGHDRLTGGLGNDVLHGQDGNHTIHGDAVGEGVPNWELELTGGVDYLYGGAGNDVLVGQYGADHLWGGSGADQFGYNQFTNSNEQTGVDRIYDFYPGEGDVIYLSNAADADPHIAGRQNYQYVESRAPGQENVGTLTPYDSDGDGSSTSSSTLSATFRQRKIR